MSRTPRSISAADLLRSYNHASLQRIARQHGVDIKSKSKSALISPVARTLYDPASIRRALDDLEPGERDALDSLILLGGEVSSAVLRQLLEAEGKIDRRERNRFSVSYQEARGSSSVRGSRKFEDIVARLGALGLVFTVDTSPYNRNVDVTVPGQYLFIPDGVMEHLPPVTLALETIAAPGEQKLADADAFLRDLYVLLSFAQERPIPLTVRGQIPKRTLVQIDESLRVKEGASGARSESDLGRLPLLRSLAEGSNLLMRGTDGLLLGDTAPKFLSLPRGERRKQLYDAYSETIRWSELSRLRDVSITPRDAPGGPGISAARKRVLAELAELPAERWISMSHLMDRMRVRAFEFLLPRAVDPSSYYYNSYYASNPNPYSGRNSLGVTFLDDSNRTVGWETVEAGFIRAVVTEALYWLGVVDLGYESGEDRSAGVGQVTAFRITQDGATLLAGGTPPSPELAPNVVIQPNFQLFAFEPTGEDVLFTLDRLAQRVRVEQVVEYQLTRESVYRAQRHGMDIADILTFLDRVSTTPLPQNVRRSLEEWGAQHERIVVRRSTPLVHAVDEAALDALYADPELGRLLGRRIAPTAALVPAEHLDAVYAHLLRDGWSRTLPLPALSEGDDTWPTRAVEVDHAGCIAFRQPLPSIFIQRALRSLADERPDGTLQLTRDSLRRAAGAQAHDGSRDASGDIIATIERFHAGELPQAVRAMIRRWAKHWGRGSLIETVLLQVESAQILDDLMTDPDLKPYLRPLPGAPTFALVQGDTVEHVRALLEDRGMLLSTSLDAR